VDPAPYRTLAPWLRATFGREVHRVALDAGSSCPNRDGTKAFGGCTYCDVEGSGTGALRTGQELAAQLEAGIARVRRRGPDVGVIAYFQSYSNTYVSIERLREVLAVVEPWIGAPVVAVSLATRPDTFPEPAAELLAELNRRLPVWVEFGLEAGDDAVLERIRRFHGVADFHAAVARAHAAGLGTIGHAILGLPGDGRAGARRTARELARARVQGVKVHNLMILRRTQLEKAWLRGEVEVLDAATYVEWLADFVEALAPEQVLHRITGDAPLSERLAPRWDEAKNRIHEQLAAVLAARGTRQGSHWSGAPAPMA
jgi:radical SAM protein (TIGR01212 family)